MKPSSAIGLLLMISAQAASAAEALLQLPPTRYVSTLADPLFDSLKTQQLFSQLDKELYGSPLVLGAIHTFSPTAGDAALGVTSAILSGSTLGILPVVSSSDLVVTYTLSAHGKSIASYSYSKGVTQVTNIYSSQGVNQLDKATMEWVISTAEQFSREVGQNQKVRALTDEYNFYFGSGQK